MSAGVYRIADEPRPGAYERFISNPIWPFFSMMLVGAWLALPWFAANGAALGSPTLRRETSFLLAAPLVAGAVIYVIVYHLLPDQMLDDDVRQAVRYLKVFGSGAMLATTYWVFVLQSRAFGVWEYGGRTPAPGYIPLAAGFFLDGAVGGSLLALEGDVLPWMLVLL